jgi:very-short-patch-repair endonuclease
VRGSSSPFQIELLQLRCAFVNRARMLRKKATDTERTLWRHLRNRNLAGYKFRRQHPLGGYILDFYSPAAKLAIELDGGGHNYALLRTRDRTRSKVLADHGVTVLRSWNHQVRYELDSVLKSIWFNLEERPLSQPSPQSSPLGRERRICSADDTVTLPGAANSNCRRQ